MRCHLRLLGSTDTFSVVSGTPAYRQADRTDQEVFP
jgi:hypothetical protein